MKTRVAETSIRAFHAIKSEGLVTRSQQRILSAMVRGRDYSLRELAKILHDDTSSVSGRVNELKEMKLLDESVQRKCSISARTVTPVRLPAVQADLFGGVQ